MTSIYTITTDQSYLQEVFNSINKIEYSLKYQGRIGESFPIIVQEEGKNVFINAHWGVHNVSKGSRSLSQIHLSKTLKQRPYNLFLRKNRCAIPSNCFVGQNNGKTYLIKLLHDRLFCFGGFYVQNKNNKDYSFCMYETASADILRPFVGDSMPVLFEVDNVNKWLKSTSIHSLIKTADKSVYKYFDIFEISKEVLSNGANRKELLKPIGKSLKELLKERNTTDFNTEQFKKERGHRGK